MNPETPATAEGQPATNSAPAAGIGTSEFKSLAMTAAPMIALLFGKDVSQPIQITAIITLGAVCIAYICQRGFVKR